MPIVSASLDGSNHPPASAVSLVSTDRRGRRYEMRPHMQAFARSKSFGGCGRPLMGVNGVVVGTGPKGAGFQGLANCASAWLCPVCAAKIQARRSSEIEATLEWHLGRGGTVAMLTLTMRHHKGQALSDLWAALSAAWKAATNGRRWRQERETYGIDGYIRAVEVTHGDSGWHVHVHALMLFEGIPSNELIQSLGDSMFDRWSARLVRSGLAAPLRDSGGLDIRRVGGDAGQVLSTYLTKMASGAALEIGSSANKTGRKGGRSPWQLAEDAIEGDTTARGLWLEFEAASKGRRALEWSRGLKAAAGVAELTDVEVLEDEDAVPEMVAIIPAKSWYLLRARAPWLYGHILSLVDAGANWITLNDYVRNFIPDCDIRPPLTNVPHRE